MFSRSHGTLCLAFLGSLLATAVRADDFKTCVYETGTVALDACNRAIESHHYKGIDLVNLYLNRGAEWNSRQEYDKCIADETAAIKLFPESTAAHSNRANCYKNKGQYDRAIADATAAIGFDRENPQAYSVRANIYEAKGDRERAIADYKRALAVKPVPGKFVNLDAILKIARENLDRLTKK